MHIFDAIYIFKNIPPSTIPLDNNLVTLKSNTTMIFESQKSCFIYSKLDLSVNVHCFLLLLKYTNIYVWIPCSVVVLIIILIHFDFTEKNHDLQLFSAFENLVKKL